MTIGSRVRDIKDESSDVRALAIALMHVAEEIHGCRNALLHLGTNGAETDMGAIEMLANELRLGLRSVGEGLHEGLGDIAEGLNGLHSKLEYGPQRSRTEGEIEQ